MASPFDTATAFTPSPSTNNDADVAGDSKTATATPRADNTATIATNIAALTEGQAKLAAMQARWPSVDARMLSSYLKYAKGNLGEAMGRYEEFLAWRTALGPVGVTSIEQNLRADGTGKGPFMITLEYDEEERGKHTPIILMQGMIKGTRQEMTNQVVYAAERAGALMPCDGPARVKFLVNTRGGGFRVPDADYRAVVFEVLHRFYPWLENCHVIFLDPIYVVRIGLWGMGKVFGLKWKEQFKVASREGWPEGVDDEDIRTYVRVTKEEHGIGWEKDGSLKFDMEGYIERRGREEAKEKEEEEERWRKAELLEGEKEQAVASAAAQSANMMALQMDQGAGLLGLGLS
ncbi:Hypothetical protein NocV09_01100310 [Nannochloropsis oceanica]